MIHCRSDALCIGNIQPDGFYLLATHLFQPLHAPRQGEYVIAIGSQQFGRGLANTAGRSRDQCNLLSHVFYL